MLNLMIFFFMEGVVEIARSQTEENYIFIFLKEKKIQSLKFFFWESLLRNSNRIETFGEKVMLRTASRMDRKGIVLLSKCILSSEKDLG